MPSVKFSKIKTVDRAPELPPRQRAAISNGTRLHHEGEVDGRTRDARRFKDLVASFTSDLKHQPTEGDRALIRNAAACTVECEKLQAAAVAGEKISHEDLTRLANSAARILLQLGVNRDVKPAATGVAADATGLASIMARHERGSPA